MDETNPYRSPEHASTEGASSSPGRHLQDDTVPSRWRGSDYALAIAQQGFLLLLTALLLDGGFMFRVCCVAAIAHWIAILVVRGRRPAEPTTLDVGVLKFGFLFCFLLAYSAALVVLRIRAIF